VGVWKVGGMLSVVGGRGGAEWDTAVVQEHTGKKKNPLIIWGKRKGQRSCVVREREAGRRVYFGKEHDLFNRDGGVGRVRRFYSEGA